MTIPSVGTGVLRSVGLALRKNRQKPTYLAIKAAMAHSSSDREHDISTFPLWDASLQRGLGGGCL